MPRRDQQEDQCEPPIPADALKMKRILDALRSRDVSSMGFEVRILHQQRIEQLAVRYTEACSGGACLPVGESPS